MKIILLADQQLTIFLKNLFPDSDFFNYFFSFFSLKGNSIFIWLLVVVLVLIFEEKKNPGFSKNDKKFVLAFFISFLTTAFLVQFPLKNLFQRPRPTVINKHLNTQSSPKSSSLISQLLDTKDYPLDFSFPSGHAATAFASTAVLSFFDKKRKWFYYFLATIIAYSRVFLGYHYFLDVFFGGIIGLIIGKTITKVITKE